MRTVIPGHGPPFAGIDGALERAYSRLAAFEADPLRVAHHGLKVMLAFALLDRERIALAAVPEFLAGTGFCREINAAYFRLPAEALAARLVGELTRAGAAAIVDGVLISPRSARIAAPSPGAGIAAPSPEESARRRC